MSPERIQLKRTKGWRKPEDAIVVSRPSEWGNPYQVSGELTSVDAVALYRSELLRDLADPQREEAQRIKALRGHDLCCWCPLDQPCHADVLLELANA